MENTVVIYFIYYLLFQSVACIFIVVWRCFRWLFSNAVNSDTYNDTGLVIILAMGSSIMAAFLLNVG